jgi:hypothetical protein
MNPATRTAFRWFHIAGAVSLGAYLYSPWGGNPVFAAVVLWAVFPVLGLSGLVMWQWGRISRLRGPRRA